MASAGPTGCGSPSGWSLGSCFTSATRNRTAGSPGKSRARSNPRSRLPQLTNLRGARLAVLLLLGVLAGGTVGYMVIEGWNAWDAFYMTVTTVATVGFREVHPLSLGGQVFTILLIFSGVGTALYTVTLLATIIVEGGLHRSFAKRRAARMLEL